MKSFDFTYIKWRSGACSFLRDFFQCQDYLEVNTPILTRMPGVEASLSYFSTDYLDYHKKVQKYFLRSSPEIHMKVLLAQGAERIFQIAPCFRNGGEKTAFHHPEFMMLEWYDTSLDKEQMLTQTTKLIQGLAQWIEEQIPDSNQKISLQKLIHEEPKRLSLKNFFSERFDVSYQDSQKDFYKKLKKCGFQSARECDDWTTLFYKVLVEVFEKDLGSELLIIEDYPESEGVLSKGNNGVSERFEFFVMGQEISNGYVEMNSPEENQKVIQQFLEDIQKKPHPLAQTEDLAAISVSPSFKESVLNEGFPEATGQALGLDRLLTLFLQQDFSSLAFRSELL